MNGDRFTVTYRLRCDRAQVEARAEAVALEQSVELPAAAVTDHRVRDDVMGRVLAIRQRDEREFDVDIALAEETVGRDAGQFLNMLFGNTSLQDDAVLVDVTVGATFAARFGGPRFGIAGLRELAGVRGRALSCAALKPQGLPPAALALLAGTLARSGIDIIKDDHGLADQSAAPFAQRVTACQRAIEEAQSVSGSRALYAPSITGSLEDMRRQLGVAREQGVRVALIAPMISGVSNLATLACDAGVALIAHPALAGAARILPPLLLGKLFRLFGADATIFPHAGGRFGYTLADCAGIADAARHPWHGLAATMPVPAGGMSVERVHGMREFYGDEAMFLIGGSLLLAGDALAARCRAFVDAVAAPYAHQDSRHD